MIIRFRVSNFLSISEEQELSLSTSRVRGFPEHVYKTNSNTLPDILKSALIYGSNASGKSNFVKALAFSRRIIVSNRNTNWDVPVFILKEHPINETKFYYEIIVDEICYQYGFIIKDGKIVEEWLDTASKNTENRLFTRTTAGEKVNIDFSMKFRDKDSKAFHQTICKGTRNNQLFLNFINEQNASEIEESFKKPYQWFRNKLVIIFPQSKINGIEIRLLKDKSLWDFYNTCLNQLDTGIDKLDFDEFEFSNPKFQIPEAIKDDIKQKIQDEGSIYTVSSPDNDIYYVQKQGIKLMVKKIKAVHKIVNTNKSIQFDFRSESDGTNRIMDLIPMLYLLGHSSTVIIDEIDRSFHTLISEKIFELFFNKTLSNPAQLIATTHNLMLLDLDKFRRDEIWFIEKDNHNQSCIYSLEEFKPRFDKVLRKAYLEGRFGAVPLLNKQKEFNNAL